MSLPIILLRSQMFSRPARHAVHCPHVSTAARSTLSPGLSVLTPAPSAATVPEISWPSTSGGVLKVGVPWSM